MTYLSPQLATQTKRKNLPTAASIVEKLERLSDEVIRRVDEYLPECEGKGRIHKMLYHDYPKGMALV